MLPAVDVDGSDTAIFDNVLELLHLSGRSLAHVMAMMVPEPWSRDAVDVAGAQGVLPVPLLPDGAVGRPRIAGVHGRDPDRGHAGPQRAAPGRYWVTRDGRVVMASESGVLDIRPADVVAKGRLQPGRMFLVDTAEGRIIGDDELKEALAAARPYEALVAGSLARLEDLPDPGPRPSSRTTSRSCAARRSSATRPRTSA